MIFVAVAWKVPPSMNAQRLSRALARASISFDEAREKVRRRIFSGGTPFWTSIAARRVKVLVLPAPGPARITARSEEHTSELQSLMRISYAVFCLKKKHIDTPQQRIT